jgi:hypothetical protein
MPVYVLQNLLNSAVLIYNELHLAMDAAERMVKNRSVNDLGDTLLWGPGDGSTTVMVRRMSRDDAEQFDVPMPLEM